MLRPFKPSAMKEKMLKQKAFLFFVFNVAVKQMSLFRWQWQAKAVFLAKPQRYFCLKCLDTRNLHYFLFKL